jgi:hypothetical protein
MKLQGLLTSFAAFFPYAMAQTEMPMSSIPPNSMQIIEQKIHSEIKTRAKRINCQIENSRIHFSKMHVNEKNQNEIFYNLSFREICSKHGISNVILKKKVTFSKNWKLLEIAPLKQEIKVETEAKIIR